MSLWADVESKRIAALAAKAEHWRDDEQRCQYETLSERDALTRPYVHPNDHHYINHRAGRRI